MKKAAPSVRMMCFKQGQRIRREDDAPIGSYDANAITFQGLRLYWLMVIEIGTS
jgi:hypothetical protein